MREQHPKDWENLYHQAGADGMLILSAKHEALKPLIGKTIAEVAQSRGVSPENAIIDLVLEDDAGERVLVGSDRDITVERETPGGEPLSGFSILY